MFLLLWAKILSLKLFIQTPHKGSSFNTSWNEARIIIKPLNTFYFSLMPFEIVFWWVFSCEEFKNWNCRGVLASKLMTSIRKFNISTSLNGYFFVSLKLFWKDIHHSHFIRKPNYNMKSWGMESNTIGIIWVQFTNFKSLSLVVPNSYSFIITTCCY